MLKNDMLENDMIKIKANERSAAALTQFMHTVCRRVACGLVMMGSLSALPAAVAAVPPAVPATPVIYEPGQVDMKLKVKNGEIVIRHGYFEGVWYANLDWMPLKLSYDNLDSSIKSITRSQTDYDKVAPGVFQDKNYNIVRETATGFRWNNPSGNWIEYNSAGAITRYGNRKGLTASFQYGATGTTSYITGIIDAAGNQAMWFDYTGNVLTGIRDRANRAVSYPRDASGQLVGVTDASGNAWGYNLRFESQSVTYTDAGGNTKTYITTYLVVSRTDPVPFGPFLAAGTITAVFVGTTILDWYRT